MIGGLEGAAVVFTASASGIAEAGGGVVRGDPGEGGFASDACGARALNLRICTRDRVFCTHTSETTYV